MNVKKILLATAHLIFRIRSFNNNCIKKFANGIKNKKILELGSGMKKNGRYIHSTKQFFDDSNEFIQSDINPEFGHKIIDVIKMNYENEFDIILCMNVLEHVYDFHKAIENLHRALKPGGTALIFVPVFYPFHDEPHDYWRFTEHSIRKLFKEFYRLEIKHSGIRQYPFAYYIEANK